MTGLGHTVGQDYKNDGLTGVPLIACEHIKTGKRVLAIAPTYRIHTDVASDVVLENTRDIKCIFKQAVLSSLFCSGRFTFFSLTKLSN